MTWWIYDGYVWLTGNVAMHRGNRFGSALVGVTLVHGVMFARAPTRRPAPSGASRPLTSPSSCSC
jgi:hypothetical protein